MTGPAGILNARLLVVDDQPVNVLLLETMLRGAGYTSVTTTTDSSAVCALYSANRYDLILLDLLMPGMDGFAVMAALKEVETEGYLPVLVVTAQPDHKLRALAAGAKDFVTKPFDRVEVLTRIHNMLEVRLLLREARSYSRVLERYDRLTGLPNRSLFRELLTRALERAQARHGTTTVLSVAVDGFTTVSDALGRPMGEALLRRVAERLAACIGPMDVVARLEGPVFGIIVVGGGGDPRSAELVAQTVRSALQPPLEEEDRDVTVTVSIGSAESPADTTDAASLMLQADTARHEATDAGGDTHRAYTAAMSTRAAEALASDQAAAPSLR